MSNQIVVRAYGARLLDWRDSEPIITNVLREQNKLWNKLVEIEKANREEYQKILADSDEGLAQLMEVIAGEEATMASLVESRRKARGRVRSKSTSADKPLAAAIKVCSVRLKELRSQARLLKVQAKEKAKPKLEAMELRRRDAVKSAKAEFRLWWGHSEPILDNFDKARARSFKTGHTMRFHRFEGEGSCGIRFTGGGATMQKVYSGFSDMLQIRDPLPDELGPRAKAVKADGGVRKVIEMRMGAKDESGTIPKARFLVTVPKGYGLPEDGPPLKTVTLRREMHAGRPEYRMAFMFSGDVEDRPLPDLPDGACGIEFGFKLVRDETVERGSPDFETAKGIRVGTVAWADGTHGHCVLPHSFLKRMERAEALRSSLDRISNDFQVWLKSKVTQDLLEQIGFKETDWLAVLMGKIRRAKGAYASLLLSACDALLGAPGVTWPPEIAEEVQRWRQQAWKLRAMAHHTRRKACEHRKHVYRNFAINVVRRAGSITVVDTDFAKIAQRESAHGELTDLLLAARRNRVIASPFELRMAIENAAKREGREFSKADPENVTLRCSSCGHVHGERPDDLIMVCDGCGKAIDQDVNAGRNALEFSSMAA